MQRKERRMIHCSFDLVDKFIPRIPKNRCVGEDSTIPRICAGRSIRGCLSSMPCAGDVMCRTKEIGLPIILHAYYLRCKHAVFDIKQYVPDASTTGEMWLLESPSEVRRIDYEITFDTWEWYTDVYGFRQKYPVGIKVKRTRYQDNLENFANAICGSIEEYISRLPDVSFRALMSNMDDTMAEQAKAIIKERRGNENLF